MAAIIGRGVEAVGVVGPDEIEGAVKDGNVLGGITSVESALEGDDLEEELPIEGRTREEGPAAR